MRIAIGADHAGYEIKEAIREHLLGLGHDIVDFGTDGTGSVDYPDHGAAVARAVSSSDADRGFLVCGSGQGMTMVANRIRGIRAALAWSEEIARLSRLHNDANILCLPGRFLEARQALGIVDAWLATDFEGGRHARRVRKMMECEKEE